MDPVKIIFPKAAAAAQQVGVHGATAFHHAQDAANAGDSSQRLDSLVRAVDSFDHSISASKRLPLGLGVGGMRKYYAGYAAAKAAATLLIGSGVVPGARERVGRQEITAAREHFFDGIDTYANMGRSRFGRAVADDWMGGTIEDAATGLFMLRRPDIAKPLMQGLAATRSTIAHKGQVDTGQVQKIDTLFKQAIGTYDALLAKLATPTPPPAATVA